MNDKLLFYLCVIVIGVILGLAMKSFFMIGLSVLLGLILIFLVETYE